MLIFSIESVRAGDLEWYFGSAGEYKVRVELPRKFEKRSDWPVVINVHGYRGSAFLQKLFTRFGSLKNKLGFVHVIPEGPKNSAGIRFWNAGAYCCDFENTGRDDVDFFRQLIDRLKKELGRIDATRVAVYGHSNGGFMAYKLACELNNEISAVGVIAGSMDARDKEGNLLTSHPCPDKKPVPVMHIHGDEDPTIRFEGIDDGEKGHKSAADVSWLWSDFNQCKDIVHVNRPFNGVLAQEGKETTLTHFKNCRDDAEVYFYRLHGVNHQPFTSRKFNKKILNFLLRR